jgi:glutathione synthase
MMESTRAIQCPSIALQLAGGKKVQEVLSRPGVVESFLLDPSRGPERFTESQVKELRDSWMGMWSLDREGDEGVRLARANALDLVLKPQREGGGNNVYKESIPGFLDELPRAEREAWIAMELIRPPQGLGNWLVRAGGGTEGRVRGDVVSELGIYGWALFGGPGNVKQNEGGWLVRTKGRESDEGGVAVGFSVLDTVVLTD